VRAQDPRWLSPRTLESVRRTDCPGDSSVLAAAAAETRPNLYELIGALRRGDTAFVVLREVLRHPGEYGRDQNDRALPPSAVRMRRSATGWVLVDWESWLGARGAISFVTSCEPPPTREGKKP
jgi:hypothetical protein